MKCLYSASFTIFHPSIFHFFFISSTSPLTKVLLLSFAKPLSTLSSSSSASQMFMHEIRMFFFFSLSFLSLHIPLPKVFLLSLTKRLSTLSFFSASQMFVLNVQIYPFSFVFPFSVNQSPPSIFCQTPFYSFLFLFCRLKCLYLTSQSVIFSFPSFIFPAFPQLFPFAKLSSSSPPLLPSQIIMLNVSIFFSLSILPF